MPRYSSGSILLAFWKIAALILYMSYMCYFEASLIAVAYEKPLDTAQQLLDNGITPAFTANSTLIHQLKTSPIESHRKAFAKGTFYKYRLGQLPWHLLDIAAESGTVCFLSNEIMYVNISLLKFIFAIFENAKAKAKSSALGMILCFLSEGQIIRRNF